MYRLVRRTFYKWYNYQMIVAAKALLFNENNQILVLRRSSTHPRYANHLDFPGGLVERNEEPLSGVVREILEETGLTVGSEHVRLIHEKRVSDHIHYMVFAGTLQETEPAVVISWEHDQFEWISPKELLGRNIPQGVDDYYSMVIEYLSKN